MIVAMQENATPAQIEHVMERLVDLGFKVHRTTGATQTILAGVGTPDAFDLKDFEVLSGVLRAHRISSPYKLAGKGFRPEGTIVTFPNGVTIGGEEVVIMAGPCAVESREQLFLSAAIVKSGGGTFLRWRRLQAAQLALLVPGHGRRGPQAAAGGRAVDRAAGHQRSHGDLADRDHAALH